MATYTLLYSLNKGFKVMSSIGVVIHYACYSSSNKLHGNLVGEIRAILSQCVTPVTVNRIFSVHGLSNNDDVISPRDLAFL